MIWKKMYYHPWIQKWNKHSFVDVIKHVPILQNAFLIYLRCIQLDTNFEFRLNNKIQIRLSQHYYRNMHERKQIACINWKSNWILYILCCLSAVLTFEVTHNPMLHRTDLFITLFSILAIRKHLAKVWMHGHETIICYLCCYFQFNQNT